MHYYPVQKNWRKIKPHLGNADVQVALVRDFGKYTMGRWEKEFLPGMTPTEWESCDWRCDRRGRQPEYWDYVKHGACHWLVGFARRLAVLTEPKRPWRIVTSQAHSTCWDGDETLFDLQFLALGVAPDEAWRLARTRGRVLRVGRDIPVHLAPHYSGE